MRRSLLLLPLVLALVAALGLQPLAASGHTLTNGTIESHDGTTIAYSLYRPAGASADNPAPVIMHSHGWGGSRTNSTGAFSAELGAGFGVLSFDQRGFGASGDKANVQDPELEGRDVIALIDFLAEQDWVAKDRDAQGNEIAGDPVLFAMGGSYGGGYQLIGALTEVRLNGSTRFNALAPDMTWFNLARSLAPEQVVRTGWAAALYALGATSIVEYVHTAFAYGASTGQWPDGTVDAVHDLETEFFNHSPAAFVADGDLLDIPVLVRQGATDNLFNLNEGIHNFEQTLTDEARERSIFVGYNGGHALPSALPLGTPLNASAGGATSDVCAPDGFAALQRAFFQAVLNGDNPRALTGAAYSFSTAAEDACVQTDEIVYEDHTLGVDVSVTSGTLTTTGAGAPQHHEVAAGPITVAGIPWLNAQVTTAGADQRVFFALSVGETPATAMIVQNNMMPLRELLPVVQEQRRIELPGVAVEVPEGQNLYLTVSPVSDMSFGHGSVRTPGVVGLENLVLELPVISD